MLTVRSSMPSESSSLKTAWQWALEDWGVLAGGRVLLLLLLLLLVLLLLLRVCGGQVLDWSGQGGWHRFGSVQGGGWAWSNACPFCTARPARRP